MKTSLLAIFVTMAAPLAALAQSNVDTTHKYAWSENAGWLNWRDSGSPAGAQGVRMAGAFLSGFIWAENLGWINVGDGSPANGVSYANVAGSDFGLNVAPNGSITGLAWGENIGWINFGAGAMTAPPQPVRLLCSGRFIGFAWSENVGWIDLSVAEAGKHVEVSVATTPHPCDINGDGTPNGRDVQAFVNLLLLGGGNWSSVCAGDVEPTPDGVVDVDDVPGFVTCLLN